MEKSLIKSKQLPQQKNITYDYIFSTKCKSIPQTCDIIYGFGRYKSNCFFKRIECFFKKTIIFKHEQFTIIRLLRSFLPRGKDVKFRYNAHLYYLYFIKTYRALRHLLGLPVRGQRTWSNANNQKLVNVDLKKLFASRAWKTYPFLTKTYSNTAALAEYSNYIWRNNWLSEWEFAAEKIKSIRKSKNIVKIDLHAMSKFFIRIERGDYKISKKTKQKKKVEKRGNFTTGLKPGFARLYLCKSSRELRHLNLQVYFTRTSGVIQEKLGRGGKQLKKKKDLKLGKGLKNMKVFIKMNKKKKKTVWD